MAFRTIAIPLIFGAASALAQTTAPAPAFEVASVKRIAQASAPPTGWQPPRQHGRYTLQGVSLKVCLYYAFHLASYRITAPAWAESERYEINATMPADTPDDQVLLMLQRLLVERFQIKFHWEEKETPVYAMVVGKNGPRLKETEDPTATPLTALTSSGLQASNRSLEDLAAVLTLYTDRPVLDFTGISGKFDFKLSWSSRSPSLSAEPPADEPTSAPRPAMSAIRGSDLSGPLQSLAALGLKPEARKMPLKFLIVDSASRVPSEN